MSRTNCITRTVLRGQWIAALTSALALGMAACGGGGSATDVVTSDSSTADRGAGDGSTDDAADESDFDAAGDSAELDVLADDVAADTTRLDVSSTDTIVDRDRDGLDDTYEQRIATEYMPFRSFDPTDGCPRQVVVFRLRPHPAAPTTRLHMIVVTLLETDCGAGGHPGDDEVFGVTIDPSRPAPAGIVAVRAIAHQSTACEHISNCGQCTGLSACSMAARRGSAYPVVYFSRNKHGAYADIRSCTGACFFTNYCTLAPTSNESPPINAGEPGSPLVTDLTDSGYITAAAGWTNMSLYHYNPWSLMDFGGAGAVGSDLDDRAFLTDPCLP